jgi:hypothetical protein
MLAKIKQVHKEVLNCGESQCIKKIILKFSDSQKVAKRVHRDPMFPSPDLPRLVAEADRDSKA